MAPLRFPADAAVHPVMHNMEATQAIRRADSAGQADPAAGAVGVRPAVAPVRRAVPLVGPAQAPPVGRALLPVALLRSVNRPLLLVLPARREERCPRVD